MANLKKMMVEIMMNCHEALKDNDYKKTIRYMKKRKFIKMPIVYDSHDGTWVYFNLGDIYIAYDGSCEFLSFSLKGCHTFGNIPKDARK